MSHRTAWKIALLLWLVSLPLKLLLARNLPWEIDYVPLIWRGWQFLQGGPFPAVGTLSSVAAYNMPFLVWLHLPALALTRHAGWAMLLTMLAWNALSSAYIYALGRALFRPAVGVLAVLIFTFSSSGISGAYTSWAQLLLPGFYAMTLYHLWQWHRTTKDRHLILCGVIALCAFMTHFSAVVLFPAVLIGALLLRVRWSLRGLLVGVGIGVLLLAPYLAFEVGRDFADVRAFTSRAVQVAPDILAQYEPYKSGYTLPQHTDTDDPPVTQPPLPDQLEMEGAPPEPDAAPSLRERLSYRLSETWLQVQQVVAFPSTQELYVLREAVPLFYSLPALMTASLWAGVFWALFRVAHLMRRSGRRNTWAFWRESDAGRALFVTGFGLFSAALMIGLRAGQYTYYMGLISLIYILIAYAWMEVWRYRFLIGRLCILGLVALWLVGNTADRLMVDQQHNDQTFSPFNAALYRHAEDTAAIIAADWNHDRPLRVSYDLLPELPNFWWLPAWGTVDPLYRMGASYDVLLDINHGLTNLNQSPLGPDDKADYLVIQTPALERYASGGYEEIGRAGTTVILRPIRP